MSDESNLPPTPAEHPELFRQSSHCAYGAGETADHPNIRPQDQVDGPAPGSLLVADF